jgi:hypothetical protein
MLASAQSDDRPRIYAPFLCLQATGMCNKMGTLSPLIFNTLRDCQYYARTITVSAPSPEGRFYMGGGKQQWIECRSRPVDTWTPEPP